MNNNVLDSIINIDTAIQEADTCVVEALINLIDKNEMIQEWSDNEDFSELFMESMMWFTEAASKDKDEITKWMAKKGYWYDGDNPKKKKECNRMYQFLKQHNFRPSDETYLSDIDDGNGGKRRIKLRIDYTSNDVKDSTKKIAKDHYTIRQQGKLVSPSERIWQTEVNSGRNGSALMDPDNPVITIGSKKMKGKQAKSQTTLKHEEGHVASAIKSNGRGYTDADDPKLREEMNAYKAEHGESSLNSHDDSIEEIKADEYAAKHAKFRTKKAGSSRKMNEHDIDMSRSKYEKTCFAEFLSMIKQDLKILKNKKRFLSKLNSMNDVSNRKQMKNILFTFDIDGIGVGEDSSKIKEITKGFIPHVLNGEDIIKYNTKFIEGYERSIQEAWADYKEWKSKLKELEAEKDKYFSGKSGLYTPAFYEKRHTQYTEMMDLYLKTIKKAKKDIEESRKEIEDFKRLSNDPDMIKRLNLIDHKYTKKDMTDDDKETINKLWKEIKDTGYIDEWIKKIDEEIKRNEESVEEFKEIIKIAGDYGMQEDLSSSFRNKKMKEAIKEYFEELTNDYYFAE